MDARFESTLRYAFWLPEGYKDTVICAGATTLRTSGTCEGDSGGPLMWRNNSASGQPRWVQRGIVSGGYVCGDRDHPGRFVRLDSFEIMTFIAENTDDMVYSDLGRLMLELGVYFSC